MSTSAFDLQAKSRLVTFLLEELSMQAALAVSRGDHGTAAHIKRVIQYAQSNPVVVPEANTSAPRHHLLRRLLG